MIMYRDVTDEEFKKLMNNEKLNDVNNYDGMHFFKYLYHAKMYLHNYGKIILACDIPEYLIEELTYVYFYPYKRFEVGVPIPEYVIKKGNFDYAFINGFNPSGKDDDGKNYSKFLKEMYCEWKRISKDYANDKYGFYDYVVDYFKDKNLDDVISGYKNNKKRVKTK